MIFKDATEISLSGLKLNPFSIAWLFPHADLARDPSNRLRRYQISRHLSGMPGLVTRCENFFFYDKKEYLRENLLKFDIVVIFNINEYDLDLIKFLREKGKIVIFDHSENIFGLGCEDAVLENVSAITCCSTALAENTQRYLKLRNIEKPIFVIRDPLDDDIFMSNRPYPNGYNTALIMGMGANVQYVLPVLEKYCRDTGYKIIILTEAGFSFPGHRVEFWTPYNWIEHALGCSVALCYHSTAQFPAKGNVKVTTPMSIGLPVIAVPIQAYTEAIQTGYNGFVAFGETEWVAALNQLKDPGLRNLIGLRGRQSARSNYSTSKITLDYLSMISYLITNKGS